MRALNSLTSLLIAALLLACSEGNLTTTSESEPNDDGATPIGDDGIGPHLRIPRRGELQVPVLEVGLRPPVFRVAFRFERAPVTGLAAPYTVQIFQGSVEQTDGFTWEVGVSPAPDAVVTDGTITFQRPGPYTITVTARRDATTLVDHTELTVGLGEATSLSITTSPDVVRAGELMYFELHATDSVGNPLDPTTLGADLWLEPTGAELSLDPAELVLTQVGRYELHAETAAGLSAVNVFHVRPNTPELLDLTLAPFEDLDPGDALDYTIYAEDAYGNVVDTVEVNVFTVPAGGISDGARVTFVEEGLFEVVAEVPGTPLRDTEGPVLVDGFGPVISIKSPDRGIFIRGGTTVSVSINVYDNASGVARVDINGQTVALDSHGDATFPMTPVEGVNVIDINAWDVEGHLANRNQAFLWGTAFIAPEATIWNSLIARINQNTIDLLEDWVEAEFSVAQLRSLVLSNPRIWGGCLDLLFWTPCAYVDATNFTMSYLSVNMTPRDDGYISLYAGIRNVDVTIHVSGTVSITGHVKADWADLNARLRLWVDTSDNIRVSMDQISVNLRGFRIDDFLPDWLSFVEGWISDWVEDDVEDAIQSSIASQAPAAVDNALTELEISTTVDVLGTNVTVEAIPNYFTTRAAGISLTFGSNVMASTTDPDYDGLGVLRTYSGLPTYGTTPGFILSLGDEFLNQALYAIWESGSMAQLFEDEVIPELDTTFIQSLVPGASGLEFEVDPLLPPVFRAQLGWGTIGEFQLGDTMIDIYATFARAPRQLVARVAISAFLDAAVTIDAQNTVQVTFAGNPAFNFDGVYSALPNLTGEDLAELLTLVVPVIVPDLLDQVQEFPLPSFQGFRISSPTVTLSGDELDFINIQGNLVQQ